jgi:hypothetical protein
MSAMANILVKDDSLVETILYPVTDTPMPYWRAKNAAIPNSGQLQLWASTEDLKSGTEKVMAKTVVPVLEAISSEGNAAGYIAAPQVAYETTIITTMYVNPRATPTDRSNALRIHLGVLQGASSTTATGVINQASADDTVYNSGLPITQLFAAGVIPN